MSLFDSVTDFFSGGKQSGYGDMMKYLQQGMGEMKDYTNQANNLLNPYRDAGLGQLGGLQQAIGRMMDPNSFNNWLMKGYQTSPQAQNAINVGTQNSLNAANASGMLGSSDMMKEINQNSQQTAANDMQRYFQNQMGIYNQGLGQANHLFDTGFGATGQMSGNLSNLAQAIAQMYGQMGQAKMGQDQADSSGLGNLISGAAGIAAFL
jgi:hypothetical protein